MRTRPDCIPCFFRQALAAARLARPDEPTVHERVLFELATLVSEFDMEESPPALAGRVYAMIRSVTGVDDCFTVEKHRANERVLELLPDLERLLRSRRDPLAAALEIAIIGNYMDAGVATTYDWEAELRRLGNELDAEVLEGFRSRLRPGAQVLIIGDNAGEIGLDRLLVSEIFALGADPVYAVRGRAILNDATLEDAARVGLDRVCRVVSSGVDTPGAVLHRCNDDFKALLRRADLVLAKGQGNYEALTGMVQGMYFAFKVKCPVVAERTGLTESTSVFLQEP